MDTKFGWRNVGKAGMLITSAAVFAYSTAGDYFGFPVMGNWKTLGILFALALFVAAILWQFMDLQSRIDGFISVRPRVEAYELPFADVRPIIRTTGKQSKIIASVVFFHMRFADNPRLRVEQATARKVFAEISYFSQSKQRLVGPIFGRWGDTDQPATRSPFQPTRDLLAVDLESSGLPRELNLALKYPQEDVIYAFNNDSYSFADWKNPSFILSEQRIFIHIRLSGENVDDANLWILLENQGNSQTLRLTVPLDVPKDQGGY